jgi:radical SAM superfamily enzyme YgiQ (UPF0313 family)
MTGKRAYQPPLALITVAALLPQEWDFTFIDGTFREVTPEDWRTCDLVLVSGTIVHLTAILETIKEAKQKGKTVAVGGAGVFHFHEEALSAGADFVVRGEAEVTVPALLDALDRGESGITIEARERADITRSPVPRYDLLDLTAYVDVTIQFSRGCPFRCEFCDVTVLYGREVRTKTPAQILEELQALYLLGWRRQVLFVDDNFIGNPSRAKALLRQLIPWMEAHRRPFEFFTCASVNLGSFPELMNLMVRAGFTRVMLGIETTDKEPLKIVKKYQNAAVDMDKACEKITRAGLQILALTMMGLDGEMPGRDRRIIDFATKHNIPEVYLCILHAFPGTALWDRVKEQGRLLDSDYVRTGDWKSLEMNLIPTRPPSQIVQEFVNVFDVLYEPGCYLDRAFNHFASMDPSPVKQPLKLLQAYEIRVLVLVFFKNGLIRPIRGKFWKYIWRAMRTMSLERFINFIRTCVTLEHYLGLREDLKEEVKHLSLSDTEDKAAHKGLARPSESLD